MVRRFEMAKTGAEIIAEAFAISSSVEYNTLPSSSSIYALTIPFLGLIKVFKNSFCY
jgi:hypothetical protein